VLGPGSIAHAHAIDERVDLDEVVRCARLYSDIMLSEP
jgi:acetylornithine deacetylase/succinyl-diaminopimelate desuccinylase-like protein